MRKIDAIGSAAATAQELHLPDLAHDAGVAFTESMQVTNLIGGLLMLGVAATVFALVPKGTRLDATNSDVSR